MSAQEKYNRENQDDKLSLHPNRFFSSSKVKRKIALRLFSEIESLPIVSPHGHAEPQWFAENPLLGDPASVLVQVDHYVFRMLYSQGVALESLGMSPSGMEATASQREVWRTFACHYHLFLGTPTRIWLDYVFNQLFGMDVVLSARTADHYYDVIDEKLNTDALRPNSILKKFDVECLATTEGALDQLTYHQNGKKTGSLVIPTFRPDDVIDPDRADFGGNLTMLADLTGEDTGKWDGYLRALRKRREFFRSRGATATDHGHPTANTADLGSEACQQLLSACLTGTSAQSDREIFRAQMLTEMARMSVEDGMVMQLHPGSVRNHNQQLFEKFGRDKGADIPTKTDFVNGLKPLLDRFGNDSRLTLVLFTVDESTYSRELAPLAGHYPSIRLGAPWWFHDSLEGMLRFRRETTETAGFQNLVGFCDDTRGLLSIPARHDLARRIDCRFLAECVVDRRLRERDAHEIAHALTYRLPKEVYKLPSVEASEG